jgi:cardiolipin synthase
MNWPNLISLGRVVAVPLFVCFRLYHMPQAAFITFIAAGLSDALDGFLARVLNQRTILGTFLDPMADKLMTAVAFLTLAFADQVPLWLAIVVISRDLILILGAVVTFLVAGELKIKPRPLGKITTFCQFSTIAGVLAFPYFVFPGGFLNALFILTALATVLSGAQYVHAGIKAVGSEI